MGLKGFSDVFRGENEAGVAKCHELTIQKNYLIKQVSHCSQVVMGYDKQIACASQAANRSAEKVLRRLIQTREWFIE